MSVSHPEQRLQHNAAEEFRRHGFKPIELVSRLQSSGGHSKSITVLAVRVRHLTCGTERESAVSLKRAREWGFELCPTCYWRSG